MLVLVVYDIQSSTLSGKKRLQQIARKCEAIGQRVQNSVFECLLDAAQFREFRQVLLSIIDPKADRIRFYNLGNTYENKIESLGIPENSYYENPIIL